MSLSDALSQACERADVTARELAIAAGMDPGTVRAIARGQRTRASTVRQLAGGLAALADDGLDADDLADELIAAAGDELAPESAWAASRASRQRQRDARAAPEYAAALRAHRRAQRDLDEALGSYDPHAVTEVVERWLERWGLTP